MIEAIRRVTAIPLAPVHALLAGGTVLAFGWLLANGVIQPIVIWILQLYLTF